MQSKVIPPANGIPRAGIACSARPRHQWRPLSILLPQVAAMGGFTATGGGQTLTTTEDTPANTEVSSAQASSRCRKVAGARRLALVIERTETTKEQAATLGAMGISEPPFIFDGTRPGNERTLVIRSHVHKLP